MSDDTSNQSEDRPRVSFSDDYQMFYWMNRIQCTEAQLRAACSVAGGSARTLARYLDNRFGVHRNDTRSLMW